MRIPKPVRLFFAGINWNGGIKTLIIFMSCLIVGLTLLIFSISFCTGGFHPAGPLNILNSISPGKLALFLMFLSSFIMIAFVIMIILSGAYGWIKELPEYEEKEADELLDEAGKFLKLEVCEEKYKNELDILITDYNFDKTNLPIKVILRNWIDCYKDIIFLRESVKELEKKQISIPKEIISTGNRIGVLEAKLSLETQYTEQT